MTPSDRPGFVIAIQSLAAMFGREPTPALLEGYWVGLGDLPIASVRAAIESAMKTAKFMPPPAELRDTVGMAVRRPNYYQPYIGTTARELDRVQGTWLALEAPKTEGEGDSATVDVTALISQLAKSKGDGK